MHSSLNTTKTTVARWKDFCLRILHTYIFLTATIDQEVPTPESINTCLYDYHSRRGRGGRRRGRIRGCRVADERGTVHFLVIDTVDREDIAARERQIDNGTVVNEDLRSYYMNDHLTHTNKISSTPYPLFINIYTTQIRQVGSI